MYPKPAGHSRKPSSCSSERPSHLMSAETRHNWDYEFAARFYETDTALDNLVSMDPGPMDLRLAPIQVNRWFRGQTNDRIFLDALEPLGIEPGQTYVVYGGRMIGGSVYPNQPLVVRSAGVPKRADADDA